jgi:hypothetical protein
MAMKNMNYYLINIGLSTNFATEFGLRERKEGHK